MNVLLFSPINSDTPSHLSLDQARRSQKDTQKPSQCAQYACKNSSTWSHGSPDGTSQHFTCGTALHSTVTVCDLICNSNIMYNILRSSWYEMPTTLGAEQFGILENVKFVCVCVCVWRFNDQRLTCNACLLSAATKTALHTCCLVSQLSIPWPNSWGIKDGAVWRLNRLNLDMKRAVLFNKNCNFVMNSNNTGHLRLKMARSHFWKPILQLPNKIHTRLIARDTVVQST